MLVSERIGQFFLDGDAGRDRLEYTEYGSGDRWVVLLHGQLMPRRMHQPLARRLAAEGLHVVTLDLLGHGRSDRPEDPTAYSITAFAHQVRALLDHLGAEQAVVGGTSLGRQRRRSSSPRPRPTGWPGCCCEMPVLDNAVEAGIIAFAPLMFAARFLPVSVSVVRWVTRPVPRGLVPFWVGIALDTLDQRPGRSPPWSTASSSAGSHRPRGSGGGSPAGARRGAPLRPDPPGRGRRDAGREMPNAEFVQATSILEWRVRPERLDRAAAEFASTCWDGERSGVRTRERQQGTGG